MFRQQNTGPQERCQSFSMKLPEICIILKERQYGARPISMDSVNKFELTWVTMFEPYKPMHRGAQDKSILNAVVRSHHDGCGRINLIFMDLNTVPRI